MFVDQGLEVISEEPCRELLASRELGRLGIWVGATPVIIPVHYEMIGEDIRCRRDGHLGLGSAEEVVVGFAVDQIDTHTEMGWSVLVRGLARRIPKCGADVAVGPREDLRGGPRGLLTRIPS